MTTPHAYHGGPPSRRASPRCATAGRFDNKHGGT
nr:MAG TPA: hypothetical protein [Caudoviricetes sp.]